MDTIEVMLVDDHAVVRRGLRAMLDENPLISVVAEAASSVEALALAKRKTPDVVVLDVQLGDENGLDMVEPLREIQPDTVVIVLTAFLKPELLRRCNELHVSGYLVKDSRDFDLASVVIAAAGGTKVFDDRVYRLEQSMSGKGALDFTAREQQVLELVCKGYSNQEIAAELSCGEGAIKAVVSNLMRKTCCRNRVELVIKAREEWLF